jgi:hypothetical protein
MCVKEEELEEAGNEEIDATGARADEAMCCIGGEAEWC